MTPSMHQKRIQFLKANVFTRSYLKMKSVFLLLQIIYFSVDDHFFVFWFVFNFKEIFFGEKHDVVSTKSLRREIFFLVQ